MVSEMQDHTLPRALVADALGVAPDSLPEGDLPMARFATRFLTYLGETLATDETNHPEAWTFLLFDALVETAPAQALAALCACLAQCDTPDQAAMIAAGPLDDLIARQGAALIAEIETLAARAPRFAYALTGLQRPEGGAALLWARIEAAHRGAGELDAGDPLPGPDGL